jgi:hypothetical protein
MTSTSKTNPLLEIAANLARSHREHERYYSEAPLHEAIKLQRISRALKALAERWVESQPLDHPIPYPSRSPVPATSTTTAPSKASAFCSWRTAASPLSSRA